MNFCLLKDEEAGSFQLCCSKEVTHNILICLTQVKQ